MVGGDVEEKRARWRAEERSRSGGGVDGGGGGVDGGDEFKEGVAQRGEKESQRCRGRRHYYLALKLKLKSKWWCRW